MKKELVLNPTHDKFCRPAAAGAILSCSRSKLYELSESDPDFPPKIRLGARCVGWRLSDLEAYLELKAERARRGM